MKKIITLLAVVGMFSFQGCTVEDSGDNDTISTVFEIERVSFLPSNNFIVRFIFPNTIVPSDMVLVYRLGGTLNGRDVWEFLPETYYFDNGTRDFSYNFNFTNAFVDIYLNGNDLLSVPSGNRLNQVFRIVVVPANLINAVDKNNFQSVMATLKANESQVKRINL